MQNKKYVAYLHSCGLSQGELIVILEKGGENAKDFFETLSENQLLKYIKSQKRREVILQYYSKIDIQKIDTSLDEFWVKLILRDEKEYPEMLKNIPHSPYLLYVRWKLPQEDMFGVVGARKITTYGKKVHRKNSSRYCKSISDCLWLSCWLWLSGS